MPFISHDGTYVYLQCQASKRLTCTEFGVPRDACGCSLGMCPTPSGHVSADMAGVCNNCSIAVTEDEGREINKTERERTTTDAQGRPAA